QAPPAQIGKAQTKMQGRQPVHQPGQHYRCGPEPEQGLLRLQPVSPDQVIGLLLDLLKDPDQRWVTQQTNQPAAPAFIGADNRIAQYTAGKQLTRCGNLQINGQAIHIQAANQVGGLQ